MIDVEVFGAERLADGLGEDDVRRACALVAERTGVISGHLAVDFVAASRIAELNAEHRDRNAATDVLSFPIDGPGIAPGGVPRELGDIVICPEHTADITEAVIHGMLHLLGFDHESDDGEMLGLQAELLTRARP